MTTTNLKVFSANPELAETVAADLEHKLPFGFDAMITAFCTRFHFGFESMEWLERMPEMIGKEELDYRALHRAMQISDDAFSMSEPGVTRPELAAQTVWCIAETLYGEDFYAPNSYYPVVYDSLVQEFKQHWWEHMDTILANLYISVFSALIPHMKYQKDAYSYAYSVLAGQLCKDPYELTDVQQVIADCMRILESTVEWALFTDDTLNSTILLALTLRAFCNSVDEYLSEDTWQPEEDEGVCEEELDPFAGVDLAYTELPDINLAAAEAPEIQPIFGDDEDPYADAEFDQQLDAVLDQMELEETEE